jgi:hypothetical protein
MMWAIGSLFLLAFVCTNSLVTPPDSMNYTAEAITDYVSWDTLPGADQLRENVTFRFFAGYIDLNVTSGLRYYYWFFESQNDPVNDPVFLWMNGGPGCPGMASAMEDNGPIKIDRNFQLYLNPWSWNRLANVIYIDQPTGTGYSYSNTSDDYIIGDKKAAENVYTFLQGFFKKFSNFQANDFHVTTQSYGGHYGPLVTYEIVTRQANISISGDIKINLKGMAVGNPFVDYVSNDIATVNKLWGDGLIPKSKYDDWAINCSTPDSWLANLDYCYNLDNALASNEIGPIDFYALSYPLCNLNIDLSLTSFNRTWLFSYQQNLHLDQKVLYEPCSHAYYWLNNATIMQAIHAVFGGNTTFWGSCGGNGLVYNQDDQFNSVVNYYYLLVSGGYGLKFMVFSGDDDSVCPTQGTENWIFGMGFGVANLWKPWKADGQLGGFYTQFTHNLTFVTIRNAGHQVSSTQPITSFTMVEMYLNGSWFNANTSGIVDVTTPSPETVKPSASPTPAPSIASSHSYSPQGQPITKEGAITIGVAIAVMAVGFIIGFIYVKRRNDRDQQAGGPHAVLLK